MTFANEIEGRPVPVIKMEPTERGFLRSDFRDIYGTFCSLQESSLASEDAIWLGTNIEGVGGNRMHLDQNMVSAMLPYLTHFAKHGNLRLARIGVVGYCPPTKFDENEARRAIIDAYDQLADLYPGQSIAIVSGLTDVGVLAIAYAEAQKRGWMTVGVACERAMEHPLFPVNVPIVVGEKWGDESPMFVGMLDGMIRIGGGKQSIRETEEVKARGLPTLEYDVPIFD
ncbi:MAG: hypothetical protein AAB921_03790 [Patescibacteria group bacterium]